MSVETKLTGNIVDVVNRKIFPGTIVIKEGRIASINADPSLSNKQDLPYILPGFIDAHIHIESSMLIPSEFARLAVVHGTVATVSDPHEIANVLGMQGIRYMINNGKKVPFHFYFGASPCVPATSFETAGASVTAQDIQTLFQEDKLHYLSEMMNFPGVLNHDPMVMEKIQIAKQFGKPIDGHAPGLRGAQAQKYIEAGISTDHECVALDEALDKLRYGMKILIREGSAAKNFDALQPLIKSHPAQVMFCSDDKHPNDLVEGHINLLVKKAIVQLGHDPIDVLRAVSYNPIQHYKLEVGLLRPGDPANCIVVDNLHNFNVKETYIKGILVAKEGKTLIPSVQEEAINHLHTTPKKESDFAVKAQGETIRVIEAIDGELVTNCLLLPAKIEDQQIVSDVSRDILKIAMVNRYQNAPPAIGFIRNFGLKKGAIASCIAHDSHNIIAVGVSDKDICEAVNAIIRQKGGIVAVKDGQAHGLPLPVAGLMSNQDGYHIAQEYAKVDAIAKDLGTALHAPFMTLSFMALLVIPKLKLSDKGLFDGEKFSFTPLSF